MQIELRNPKGEIEADDKGSQVCPVDMRNKEGAHEIKQDMSLCKIPYTHISL